MTAIGFGTAFSGVVASLAPRSPEDEQAHAFAVINLLAYLAFGIPATVAEMLVGIVGLGAVCLGYGVVVVSLDGVALGMPVRSRA